MVAVANTGKRSAMVLYSDHTDPYSHQVRMVIAEKGISADILYIHPYDKPQELFESNPYGSLPTLVDRDLVLYESRIILEYLDERFPHPPLMPVYPIARAESRRMMYRVEKDWYSKMNIILNSAGEDVETERKELREALIGLAPVFANAPYFLSEDFSLIDCCIAPLLWRLPKLGIELPSSCKAIHDYAARVFKRNSFKTSLSEIEEELQAVEV